MTKACAIGTTYHIYHDTLSHRTKRVLSPNKQIALYIFEASPNFASTPHVTIYIGLPAAGLRKGTINFYSSIICVSLQGSPKITILPSGSMRTAAHEYESPALPGRKKKWKKDGLFNLGDLVCEDQGGGAVTRLKKSNVSLTKTGTLWVGQEVVDSGKKAGDEIVAGAVGVLELERKLKGESVGDVEGGSGY